jgi:hypothetical protein
MKQESKVQLTTTPMALRGIKGSNLDNAQYFSMLLHGEVDREKGVLALGSVKTSTGKSYHVNLNGHTTPIDHKGQALTHADMLKFLIEEGKLSDVNFDTLSYISVEGPAPDGKKFYGVYYSLADCEKDVERMHAEGKL